jgi:pantothenate kinase
LGVNEKTSDRYNRRFVKNGLLHRDQKDLYLKPETENPEEVDQKSEGEEIAKIEKTEEENH